MAMLGKTSKNGGAYEVGMCDHPGRDNAGGRWTFDLLSGG